MAISSRNLAAEISLDFGGEITATDAPLRVISISSPSATLLSTSEKLRAASVAVILVTPDAYQINQTTGHLVFSGSLTEREILSDRPGGRSVVKRGAYVPLRDLVMLSYGAVSIFWT